LKIAASRVPAFKPGAALKAAVNGGKLRSRTVPHIIRGAYRTRDTVTNVCVIPV
jgi:hypothetical protein